MFPFTWLVIEVREKKPYRAATIRQPTSKERSNFCVNVRCCVCGTSDDGNNMNYNAATSFKQCAWAKGEHAASA